MRTGIIPTCVGSTHDGQRQSLLLRDHPHLRGEHCLIPSAKRPVTGSSPPAWGARTPAAHDPDAEGIIPTCVGSTANQPVDAGFDGDHPHLRGEHAACCGVTTTSPGSSPPAWGARDWSDGAGCWRGIIPTCVGSTPASPRDHPCQTDHPHLRGEHSARDTTSMCAGGSSPPAWGAPVGRA